VPRRYPSAEMPWRIREDDPELVPLQIAKWH
jgi:hypothetical protein